MGESRHRTIVRAGYVGLASSVGVATLGHRVEFVEVRTGRLYYPPRAGTRLRSAWPARRLRSGADLLARRQRHVAPVGEQDGGGGQAGRPTAGRPPVIWTVSDVAEAALLSARAR